MLFIVHNCRVTSQYFCLQKLDSTELLCFFIELWIWIEIPHFTIDFPKQIHVPNQQPMLKVIEFDPSSNDKKHTQRIYKNVLLIWRRFTTPSNTVGCSILFPTKYLLLFILISVSPPSFAIKPATKCSFAISTSTSWNIYYPNLNFL